MTSYPIDPLLPELAAALARHRCVVLQAPPGAGKTTRVPPALLDADWLGGRAMLLLEPRRLAARAAAARIAALFGEPLGQRAGYRVRFERQVSAATRIEAVTDGILVRRLQADPELEGVGLVIFDEFHERHLEADLALALCRDIQAGLREDLRLLVMSATLDGEPLARRLDAPLVASGGRAYPVVRHLLPREPAGALPELVAAGVRRALSEQPQGDILAFLPGGAEIRRCARLLEDAAGITVHALYGDLPLEAQQRAIEPDAAGGRKVVLATNIAESSLTIEGVRTVVDSGWTRVARFDPRSGLTRLETVRVSRASADQRSGRAGRLGPGACYRLWSESVDRGLIPFEPPEIENADLAPLALELAAWGVAEAAALPWLEPPPAGALAQGRELLRLLGALDAAGRITATGREMAALPLHPRLSRMILGAKRQGRGGLACDMAAIIAERDLFRGRITAEERFEERLEVLEAFRLGGVSAARERAADAGACRAAERTARQLRRLARVGGEPGTGCAGAGALLLLAYPDRLARRRPGREPRFLLSGGRGALLATDSPLAEAEFLAVAGLDGSGRDGRIRLAAAVTRDDVEAVLGATAEVREEVRWDPQQGRVVARRVRRLGAVELASEPFRPDPTDAATALLGAIEADGLERLPWDPEARQLQARVAFLSRVMPDRGWPDLSDAALTRDLERWLGPYLVGMSRAEDLSRLDLGELLRHRLGPPLVRELEASAPARLRVPSGRLCRIDYSVEPPVLAVKLQELFGLQRTPTVAQGRVALALHLLSPAGRPVQVTRDLAGFWERTYSEVAKELRGRYPKHPWPDDPLRAEPTAATKKRGGR